MSESAQGNAGANTGEGAGIIYAATAYCAWGVLPLYWRLFGQVPPLELTVHRILWCAIFVAAVTVIRGRTAAIIAILRTPRTLVALACSSVLITANWTLYIYCVASDQLVESALGYYMTPLVSFALGFLLLGERMSRLRMLAVSLAGVAVVVQALSLGRIPWISPVLALTFGFYGYLRKRTPVAALDGLLVETLLLFPITVGLVVWWSGHGGAFPSPDLKLDALLICAGPLTAIPLAMFAAGARRVRMTTLGFLQYLAPSITLALAVFAFHEPFGSGDTISFGCVWAAIALAAVEGRSAQSPSRLVA